MAGLGNVLLGLFGIALGVNSIAKGSQRLSEGLRTDNQGGGGRVPTIVVPRSATRQMPKKIQSAVPTRTNAGVMGVSKYEVRTLGDRLAVIIDRAQQGKTDPQIIAWARRTVSQKKPGSNEWNGGQWVIPEKDGRGELNAIFKASRRDVRYTSDVYGVDTYAKPRMTLATRAGDCDEFTALGCAGAMAIGRPCRLVVIETKDSKEGANHIYWSGHDGQRWVPMDASVPMGPGWEAPDSMVRRRWIYEVE